jgi:hypothetical protein
VASTIDPPWSSITIEHSRGLVKSQCDERILVAGKKVAVDLSEAVRYVELQSVVFRR